ncbi:MAG: endopeptidase La [Clostridium sp.]|nr:endopeptidase La [Clostridium sp.]
MNENSDEPHVGVTIEHINIDLDKLRTKPNLGGLGLLTTRNLVLFPGVSTSIAIKRDSAEKIVTWAEDKRKPIGVVCQKNPEEENPTLKRGLCPIGVVADVIKVLELPNGEKTALVRAREPFLIEETGKRGDIPAGVLSAKVSIIDELEPAEGDKNFDVICKNISKNVKKIAPMVGEGFSHMFENIFSEVGGAYAINVIATNFPFDTKTKMEMLSKHRIDERGMLLLKALEAQSQEAQLNAEIMDQVRTELTEDQKRSIMQKQLDILHNQLFGDSDDAGRLAEKAEKKQFTPAARDVFDRELGKLAKMNPNHPDYFVSLNYLETLLDLPWTEMSKTDGSFPKARKELERDHCGMEKVKERVLEYIAVMHRNPNGKAPILCLVGPPGVGKTSLGKSIAAALGREYQRVSFGGLHDEAEIRGHRRTYVGAMPGRVIEAMRKASTINPVLVLDEVDKIGADYKGDPAAALLEVLDPEQNCKFHDNYLDTDYDLSHVMFIATANGTSTIARPLLDRMEIINLSGYLAEEKVEIAKKHLLRRVFEENNIEKGEFRIADDALMAIVERYTAESGVRQLEKLLAKIARKYLMATLSGEKFPKIVKPAHLEKLLGVPPFFKDKCEEHPVPGVATGLAWTEAGGEIILAEASLSKGKGAETFTGNLGQVMKESASIAYQWVKANAENLGIDPEMFEKYNLHIHFPEGAVPKDGPSAGITIATAIASAYSRRSVKGRLAMTGEITLRGKVLPVGGIKEKILAAKRSGVTDIIICADNRKDVEDIPQKYTEGLTFHYVTTAGEVMRGALE